MSLMKFPKDTPIRDKKLLASYREKHTLCQRCGSIGQEIHHIKFKGMGGANVDDRHENLILLCIYCHKEAHGVNSRQMKLELQEIKRKGK
jgi:5-methylcytosine-specific restriction endonuclease McrA